MAILVDEIGELDLSDFNTTTTTTTITTTTTTPEYDYGCNWDDWSQVVDWEALSGSQENFHDLFESIMDEGCNNNLNPIFSGTMTIDDEIEVNHCSGDLKGLRLIHLLMAAAEALTGANKSSQLARVILVRLKELVSPTDGTNMERLAAYFTEALMALLEGGSGYGKHHLLSNGTHHHRDDQSDIVAAFQLLQDMSPYVKFGHFTANQAILEAVTHDRRVHIVDYDIMEGIQWASLMQALVSRKEGPPAPHLRITALSRSGSGRRSIATVQQTGRRLIAFAASIGQPFSFHQCKLDSDETFRPSSLKLVRGEAVVINCMLHLPHFNYRTPNSVTSYLSGAKTLNPRLVTLVEEEEGPAVDGGFVGRFMDSLHHYSAVYDSLEAGFPLQSRARALVERVFLGPRIIGSLSQIYLGHGQEEDPNSICGPINCSWGHWLARAGFRPINISFANHCQAKLLLGLFNDGYKVEESAPNKLILGWKSRRLLSASIWASPDSDL